jgi:hypothetical protein
MWEKFVATMQCALWSFGVFICKSNWVFIAKEKVPYESEEERQKLSKIA